MDWLTKWVVCGVARDPLLDDVSCPHCLVSTQVGQPVVRAVSGIHLFTTFNWWIQMTPHAMYIA